MNKVIERIADNAAYFQEHAREAEELGKLPDATVAKIRETGVDRMLQPEQYGGSEAHPVEFFEAVMELAQNSPSAGWVGGLMSIHAYELAGADPQTQEEIWGEDPAVWISSPYAPFGRAKPVEGGYLFSGRWPFSSGTDHCGWAFLGGMVTDANGAIAGPPDIRHFLVKRDQYEIVEGTWDTVGLRGTGSKDVTVEDAFIPAHRVIEQNLVMTGELARTNRPDNPMYALPFGTMFGGIITAVTLGITQGALNASAEYTRNRISHSGARVAGDPHQLNLLGEAWADVDASRVHFLADVAKYHDQVVGGQPMDVTQRITARRNQVRASRRSVDAVDRLFMHAGGGSLHRDRPQQMFWRDAHAAMNHICNVAPPIYTGFGSDLFGEPIAPGVFH
ncbi:acyl-CoA dehydrogenase family protein [Streptomyces mutabilis]|uniref:acyl-CoA dehydrogenase family protein n=1 Tax=Streptomyces mutabilis TaxID=67332 RepID=UPI0036501F3F